MLTKRITDSRLSRLGSQGQTSDYLRLNTYPKDAHLGITRPVRHAYLTWSSEPHEGVGDAPALTYMGNNEKSRLLLPSVETLRIRTKGESMSKRLQCIAFHGNGSDYSHSLLGLVNPLGLVWTLGALSGLTNP